MGIEVISSEFLYVFIFIFYLSTKYYDLYHFHLSEKLLYLDYKRERKIIKKKKLKVLSIMIDYLCTYGLM